MAKSFSAVKKHVRKSAIALPEQLLCPPYALRDEMNWIDFSSIENPLGTPVSFVKAMQDGLKQGIMAYAPDREAHTLRSVLARIHGLSVDNFLVGSSISTMISAIAQTFEPCTVGIAYPCPAEVPLAVSNAGHTILGIKSPAGFVTPDAINIAERDIHIDAAVLGNPSYPTSRLLPKSTLKTYLESCDWVIVDERSIEFTLGGESMIGLVRDYPNLIVIQSFAVQYALGGAPISYCVAQPKTIAAISSFFDNSCVSMCAEVLAEASLAEHEKLDQVREFLDSEIPWLQCMLSLIPGVTIFPAEANYVLCSYNATEEMRLGVANVEELCSRLQLAGFLIHKLVGTPGLKTNGYFCVAVRTRADNEKLIAAMRKIICPDSVS